MSFSGKLYWVLTVPFSSLFGFFKLKKISSVIDGSSWLKSFHDKKVLIVGTGPSLDKVGDKYFSNFDVIIYINHAVKCSNKIEDEFFFSTDVGVVQGIRDKEYYSNIKKIGHEKSILAPIFFQQVLSLDKDLVSDFTYISAGSAKYKLHFMSKNFLGLRLPVTAAFWPVQPDIDGLDVWFERDNQVACFPVIESTSALSAILFAAKYKPRKISLIGCDFGIGRSESIKADCPASSTNLFIAVKDKFLFLKDYLLKKNIVVTNDSWVL